MDAGKPSQTALAAAWHRATHHLIDNPVLLPDPVLVAILEAWNGRPTDLEGLRKVAALQAGLRALIVARKLFAQDTLAQAIQRGVRQYVLLGAGLDTFAYQNPWPTLRVYEVDFPATGDWKRQSLSRANIPMPPNLTFAPIDFERETLHDALARAGFDLKQPAVFAWLGVVPYLTRDAIEATLRAVGALPSGTEIVFDYGEPRETLPPEIQAYMKERMARLAEIGEPWISFFARDEMIELVHDAGFASVEDLGVAAMNERWFSGRTDGLMLNPRVPTAHVLRARV